MGKINIKEILEGVNTYYYFISSTSKTILLSYNNDKDEARKLALTKLAPNIKNLIDKNVILVTIKNTEKKYKKDETLFGGPITFELQNEIIASSDKIKSGDKSKRNVFLSEKYIKKLGFSSANLWCEEPLTGYYQKNGYSIDSQMRISEDKIVWKMIKNLE